MKSMLEMRSVSVTFGRGTPTEVRALSDLSLSVEEGDYVCIVGSNGAGKSTLLNVVAGAVMADAGTVWFEGEDISSEPDYRRARLMARVFQNPLAGTCPSLSVEENLVLAETRGRARGFGLGVTKSRRHTYRESLSRLGLGLEARVGQLVEVLSGGQRQSLTVLMATMIAPRLLLLDEHTAALDPRMQDEVMRITDEVIRNNQLTALMVTHNLRMALDYGTRLIMMHHGRVVVDIDGEAKAAMEVPDLMNLFSVQSATVGDAMVLED